METNKKIEKESVRSAGGGFRSVEFMREVRSELTEQFLQDKQKYLDYLKKAMEEFKLQQQKANG